MVFLTLEDIKKTYNINLPFSGEEEKSIINVFNGKECNNSFAKGLYYKLKVKDEKKMLECFNEGKKINHLSSIKQLIYHHSDSNNVKEEYENLLLAIELNDRESILMMIFNSEDNNNTQMILKCITKLSNDLPALIELVKYFSYNDTIYKFIVKSLKECIENVENVENLIEIAEHFSNDYLLMEKTYKKAAELNSFIAMKRLIFLNKEYISFINKITDENILIEIAEHLKNDYSLMEKTYIKAAELNSFAAMKRLIFLNKEYISFINKITDENILIEIAEYFSNDYTLMEQTYKKADELNSFIAMKRLIFLNKEYILFINRIMDENILIEIAEHFSNDYDLMEKTYVKATELNSFTAMKRLIFLNKEYISFINKITDENILIEIAEYYEHIDINITTLIYEKMEEYKKLIKLTKNKKYVDLLTCPESLVELAEYFNISDIKFSFLLYKKAADLNSSKALKYLLIFGQQNKDEDLLNKSLNKLFDLKDIEMLIEIARYYRFTDINSEMVEKVYRKAVDLNSPEAMNNLGHYFKKSKDPSIKIKCLPLFFKAINEHNYAPAMNNLALYFMNEKKDFTQAELMFRKAHKYGDTNALKNIARIYMYKRNYKKMEELFLESGSLGNSDAYVQLAGFYEGWNNLNKAIEYLVIALSMGNESAFKKLKNILTTDDLFVVLDGLYVENSHEFIFEKIDELAVTSKSFFECIVKKLNTYKKNENSDLYNKFLKENIKTTDVTVYFRGVHLSVLNDEYFLRVCINSGTLSEEYSSETLRNVIQFLYLGEFSGNDVNDILKFSEEYCMYKLKDYCNTVKKYKKYLRY